MDDYYQVEMTMEKFQSVCSCLAHDAWTNDDVFSVRHITRSKCFSKSKVNLMKKKNLLPQYAVNLCTVCYRKFIER